MAPKTFHYFQLLPLELRLQIYILATPPRIIEILEKPLQSYPSFRSEFNSKPLPPNFRLHPSLSHFARSWRHEPLQNLEFPPHPDTDVHYEWRPHSPWPDIWGLRSPAHLKRQVPLEDYGFRTSKPTYQPWSPTAECPEIPLHTLIDRPDLVWQFARESYLYSKAPIPALLHTCVDSRRALMEYGYKLCFSTRTSGPRIWFCARDDVVYLRLVKGLEQVGSNRSDFCWERSHIREHWGLDRFLPADLERIRRVALEDASVKSNCYERNCYEPSDAEEIFNDLSLCGGVQEVWTVEWNLDRMVRDGGLREQWEKYVAAAGWGDHNQRGCELELEVCEEGRRWGWVGCDEADVLNEDEWPDIRANCDPHSYGLLPEFKERGGNGGEFFDNVIKNFEKELEQAGRRAGKHDEDKGTFWKVPKVQIVHVGTMAKMKMLFEMRNRYWKAFEETEMKELECGIASVDDLEKTRFSVQQSKSDSFSQAWKDDIEVLNEQDLSNI